jgi:topoisomerase-4 subunit B
VQINVAICAPSESASAKIQIFPDCISHDLAQSEVFLVEGDSAGGSAKQARDKEYQAILPLRGKILNTWEVDSDQVLASNEIHDISVAIGLEPNNDDILALESV